MRIIRKASLPGYDLGDYIRESIDFLRQHEPREGYFVGFSGGKDSIVALHLCRLAGVKHEAFYSCTRIDPPEMYAFIKRHYPDVTWLYPAQSVYAAIQRKCPPLRMVRWCCDVLKKNPSKRNPLKHRIMGIRSEESDRRASRPRVDTYGGRTIYKPIFKWPEWAIWEAIDLWQLPYPSLYDEGFSRIGCVVCPYILGISPGAMAQRQLSMKRWPGIWRAFEMAVKRWWTSGPGRNPRPGYAVHANAEAYWQAYLHSFEGRYAHV